MSCTSQTLTVRIPLAVRRPGGRKIIILPEHATDSQVLRTRADPALVKALARAHRWKRLLKEGQHASLTELAKSERIDRGYLGRMLLLTLLAPDIIEIILDGRQPAAVTLPRLLKAFPMAWSEQRLLLR
jgi:hypothetical protein